MTEIPTATGEAVPGDRDRPVLPPAARCGHRPASRRRPGVRGDQDGRGRPRRPRRDLARGRGPAGRLPHRPGIHLHRERVHQTVPPARHPPVDGQGRVLLRQRRRRGVLLSLEWEVLSRHDFADPATPRPSCWTGATGSTTTDRRHSTVGMMSPINYENTLPRPPTGKPHREALHDSGGTTIAAVTNAEAGERSERRHGVGSKFAGVDSQAGIALGNSPVTM